VVAPTWDGKLGILPRHAPMVALLGSGELSIDRPGGGSERFFVAGGVLKVEGDDLMILTEYGGTEAPDELPAAAGLDSVEILDAMETAG
jgi:F0F1-type ATP synthase epsilon subunit